MRTVRTSFEKNFGKKEAEKVWNAACGHENGINSTDKGKDPFKWALAICLGYQCMEVDGYRKHHGIKTPWVDLKKWVKKYGHLDTHTGDVDYLSLFAGVYNDFMPKKRRVER